MHELEGEGFLDLFTKKEKVKQEKKKTQTDPRHYCFALLVLSFSFNS